MEKNSLLVLIFEGVCGLVCIGLGIYYICCEKTTQAAVFLVVGAVCIVIAVRTFITMRKSKKNKDKNESDKTK